MNFTTNKYYLKLGLLDLSKIMKYENINDNLTVLTSQGFFLYLKYWNLTKNVRLINFLTI